VVVSARGADGVRAIVGVRSQKGLLSSMRRHVDSGDDELVDVMAPLFCCRW
jgi:hypothetical protein